MEFSYDAKRSEINQRIAQRSQRPDADFAKFQMTRQQAMGA
jgi:hypothetical protein